MNKLLSSAWRIFEQIIKQRTGNICFIGEKGERLFFALPTCYFIFCSQLALRRDEVLCSAAERWAPAQQFEQFRELRELGLSCASWVWSHPRAGLGRRELAFKIRASWVRVKYLTWSRGAAPARGQLLKFNEHMFVGRAGTSLKNSKFATPLFKIFVKKKNPNICSGGILQTI